MGEGGWLESHGARVLEGGGGEGRKVHGSRTTEQLFDSI